MGAFSRQLFRRGQRTAKCATSSPTRVALGSGITGDSDYCRSLWFRRMRSEFHDELSSSEPRPLAHLEPNLRDIPTVDPILHIKGVVIGVYVSQCPRVFLCTWNRFESLEISGFEQLCNNYAMEKIQGKLLENEVSENGVVCSGDGHTIDGAARARTQGGAARLRESRRLLSMFEGMTLAENSSL